MIWRGHKDRNIGLGWGEYISERWPQEKAGQYKVMKWFNLMRKKIYDAIQSKELKRIILGEMTNEKRKETANKHNIIINDNDMNVDEGSSAIDTERDDYTRRISIRLDPDDYDKEMSKRMENYFASLFFDNEEAWIPLIRERIRRQLIWIFISRDKPPELNFNLQAGLDLLELPSQELKRLLLNSNELQNRDSLRGQYQDIWAQNRNPLYGRPGEGQRRSECGWMAMNFLLCKIDRQAPESWCIKVAEELTDIQRQNNVPQPERVFDASGNYNVDVLNECMQRFGSCDIQFLAFQNEQIVERIQELANNINNIGFLLSNSTHWWAIGKINNQFFIHDTIRPLIPIQNINDHLINEIRNGTICIAFQYNLNAERTCISHHARNISFQIHELFSDRWS